MEEGGLVGEKRLSLKSSPYIQQEGCFVFCGLSFLFFFFVSFKEASTWRIVTIYGPHGFQRMQSTSVHRHDREPSKCNAGEGDCSQPKQVGHKSPSPPR